MSKNLVVCVVNFCLRWTDSLMHREVLAEQRKGHSVLYILLAIGGEHKQRVDRQFATELAVPVHALQPHHIYSFLSVLYPYDQVAVYHQNVVELRRALGVVFNKQTHLLQRVLMKQFDDCVALNRSQLVYSPVYSLFNKRARKCIRPVDGLLWTAFKPLDSKVIRLAKNQLPLVKEPITLDANYVFSAFRQRVENNYEETRNAFGSLFEYDPPSSSFMSPFISAGRVSVRQLLHSATNNTYKDELLWNQYCLFFIEHYGDDVLQAEYGPYTRRTIQGRRITWLPAEQEKKLIQSLKTCSTSEPLINAIMNYLMYTGFVPNRLRMVFASWCFQQRIDWRAASALFEEFLLDYSQASNVFNWLFSYNLTLGRPHVFNVDRQISKYDPRGLYIAKWSVIRYLP